MYFLLCPLLYFFNGCTLFSQNEECEEIKPKVCLQEPINVCLEIEDKRWSKKGGYGMPNISLYLTRDLGVMIQEQVECAFAEANLHCGYGDIKIKFEIEQFFCDVVARRSTWNCVSEIIISVFVVNGAGENLYKRRIDGLAENDFEITEKSGKSRKALDSAVEDALDTLLDDPGFIRMLKKAQRAELDKFIQIECFKYGLSPIKFFT